MTNYYLVNIASQELSYWKANADPSQPATWVTETVAGNTVCNVIAYDGVSPYTPPENMTLNSSDNVYNIGDAYNG